jgi:hypothetical protein
MFDKQDIQIADCFQLHGRIQAQPSLLQSLRVKEKLDTIRKEAAAHREKSTRRIGLTAVKPLPPQPRAMRRSNLSAITPQPPQPRAVRRSTPMPPRARTTRRGNLSMITHLSPRARSTQRKPLASPSLAVCYEDFFGPQIKVEFAVRGGSL